MKEYTITRDGQRDLRFTGEKLADASNQWVAGKENNRWHELALYRTATGRYVLQEEYVTRWQGETGASNAVVCATAQEALDVLANEDGGLSALDKELLQEAAKVDEAFSGLWAEVVD